MHVTPVDMQSLYDDALLVQATNYSDRSATGINLAQLQTACDTGNRLVDSYLLPLGIPIDRFRPAFRLALLTHAARLAMDFLAGTDPQIREQAKESLDWLKNLSRLSQAAIANLVEPDASGDPTPGVNAVLPNVFFAPGRAWQVDL